MKFSLSCFRIIFSAFVLIPLYYNFIYAEGNNQDEIIHGFRTESEVSTINLKVNKINVLHTYYPQFKGNGMTISIKEDFPDTNDLDIRGRYIGSGLESNIPSQHATDMATIIGGAGNLSVNSLGIASEISFSSSNNNNLYPDDISILNNLGITIQNHSYGLISPDMRYSDEAAAYDQQMYSNPNLLHVVSAGNIGDSTPSNGLFAGIENFSNISGAFKMAKNNITVGAIDEYRRIDPRNSRGPAHDGRIKPEIVAHGKDGTSDAAALVSGVAALLKEASQSWYSSELSSSAIKAILIAGSEDVGPAGVDYISGYGNVDARESMRILENGQLIEDIISKNQENLYNISIPAGKGLLKIALVWTDPPALPDNQKALINDLDLSLTAPDSTVWHPWVLSTTPDSSFLTSLATRNVDRLNNAEFISIEKPDSGVYSIKIFGHDISGSAQSFSVAYSIIPADTFSWTYPLAEDILPSNEVVSIHWESTEAIPIDRIEYKFEDAPWQLYSQIAFSSDKILDWQVPGGTGRVLLRAVIGGNSYVSDTFRINPDASLNVEFNCENQALISWPEIPDADAYGIYTMGETRIEKISETVDPFFTIDKSERRDRFFRIFPIFNGIQGYSERGFFYDEQGVNCYYISAGSVNFENRFIRSSIELSTTRNVITLQFERSLDGLNYESLSEINITEGRFTYTIDDYEPLSDFSYYRIRIIRENQEPVIASESFIYFPFPETFKVFPNPLESGGFFTLLIKPEDQTLRLYNTLGQSKKSWKVNSEYSEFDLPSLETGTYILHLTENDGRIKRTKVFIH